jgi:autotransporter-associated beta strand protein
LPIGGSYLRPNRFAILQTNSNMTNKFLANFLSRSPAPRRRGSPARRNPQHKKAEKRAELAYFAPARFEQLEARRLLTTLFTAQYGAETVYNVGSSGLSSVPVFLIFWGSYWENTSNPVPGSPGTTENGPQEEQQIENAVYTICNSGFFSDEAVDYGTDGKVALYNNQNHQPWYNDTTAVPATNNQTAIDNVMQNAIDNGPLPRGNNAATGTQNVYLIFTPPGTFTSPTALAYNTATAHFYTDFEDVGYVTADFDWIGGGGGTSFNINNYTTEMSHELAEGIVDPQSYNLLQGGYYFEGWRANPGASFPNPPGNSSQICDYEGQNHIDFVNGVEVQSYWSPSNNQYIIPDGNQQNFFVSNYAPPSSSTNGYSGGQGATLTLTGGQNGNVNNTFTLQTDNLGDLQATMNGETVVFPPGEIANVTVTGGNSYDFLNIGPGILGSIPVTFTTHNGAQPFLLNGSQLTIQGNQLGPNDTITINETGTGGVQAIENTTYVQYNAGEVNNIQVNLGSSDNVNLDGYIETIVPTITFANAGAPGNDTLTIGAGAPLAGAIYSIGGETGSRDINCTSWLSPITYLSNFTSVTLDTESLSSIVQIDTVFDTTPVTIDGDGPSRVAVASLMSSLASIQGAVTIHNSVPGGTYVGLNDAGNTDQCTVVLGNEDGVSGAGFVGFIGSNPFSIYGDVFYDYSAVSSVNVSTDAVSGNQVNVNETGAPTYINANAPLSVTVGDSTVGAQDIDGNLYLENDANNQGVSAYNGDISVTINDAADTTARTPKLTTFTNHTYPANGTPWGSISSLAAGAAIDYEYQDTSNVGIEGGPHHGGLNNQQVSADNPSPVYYIGPPTITKISPASGATDGKHYVPAPTTSDASEVEITGANLGSSAQPGFSVVIGGIQATVVEDDAPTAGSGSNVWNLWVDTPAHAAGTVNVQVTAPGGSVTDTNAYTYIAAPTVANVTDATPSGSAARGPAGGGTQIKITGSNLVGTAYVGFGNTSLADLVVPDKVIIDPSSGQYVVYATSPAETAGTVKIYVETPGGIYPTASSAPNSSDQFTFIAAPTVSSLSASSGPWEGGNNVTIKGSGLGNSSSGLPTVDFGSGNPATIVSDDGSTLVVTVPQATAGTAGTVSLTVATGGGTWQGQYQYVVVPPTITTPNPGYDSASLPDPVTISGQDLFYPTVTFNGIAGTVQTTSPDGSKITVVPPPGTVGSTVPVVVSSPTALHGSSFNYSNTVYLTYEASSLPASLGTSTLVEGPAAGSDTDVVNFPGAWTATANASWLHTSNSGTGNGYLTFTFDANAGATRSGTLSVAGTGATLTLTVTQNGGSYVPSSAAITLAPGMSGLRGVTVDSWGNVYFSDTNNNAVDEWNPTTGAVNNLNIAGLNTPWGVATDSAGNVYIANVNHNAIDEWNAGTWNVTTLNIPGLVNPCGVAVDAAGHVYISDTGNNAIKEWNPATGALITLASGLNTPRGIAVDAAGNVYFSDTNNNAIKEWNDSTNAVTTLNIPGLSYPGGVAVDGAGNVYIADTYNNAIKEWNHATGAVSMLDSAGLSYPYGVAVDAAGNVYVADTIEELPRAFISTTAISEGGAAGSDALPPVQPTTEPLTGVFAPTSDQSWLTIGSVTGGVVDFSFTQNTGPARQAHITLLGQQITVTQASTQPPTLATVTLVEGPSAGSDAEVVTMAGAWTATPNASWLHTTASGSGNGLATFSFDANPGGTRSGTLTIAGATLTVTQAGSGYVAAQALIKLAGAGPNGGQPESVAVDGNRNVYISYTGSTIEEWNAATETLSNLNIAGLNGASGLAVDASRNVYIADTNNGAIKEWKPSTGAISTVISGLVDDDSVAVDAAGNVYTTYTTNANANLIQEWNASTQQLATLVSNSGLGYYPVGLALDSSGNVYVADPYNNAIQEWNASTRTLTNLGIAGLNNPQGVAVDSAGNVYIADNGNNAIKEWNPSTRAVSTLASGLSGPTGVAVDASGNLYFTVFGNSAVEELPRAFVPTAPISEGASAGSDSLAPVLPSTELLSGIFAPTSDQRWLTVGSVSGGVVNFSFTQNNGPARTAHITLFGQQIAVTQAAAPPLATGTLLEGPAAGIDSDLVNFAGAWTATSNASWLYTTSSGNGNGLATISFDANPAGTRSGTLTIAGETLTVTQAGSSYMAANPLTTLDSTGLSGPRGVALDDAGNVYIADPGDKAIQEWNAVTQTVSRVVSTGLIAPAAVALDDLGNIYIADPGDNTIKVWNAATQTVSTLASGLNGPEGVAVDGSGNVYIADTGNNAIKEWNAATRTVSNLNLAGLSNPEGVAVDRAGNVYIADTDDGAIKVWNAVTGQLTNLYIVGLGYPQGVAVDGSGNVYIADTFDSAIKEWNAANNGSVSTLASTGLNHPQGVAVDAAGNVYIGDTGNNAFEELPRAFVSTSALHEAGAAGSDTLAPVLPATQLLTGVFAPASNQSWLTFGNVSGGVVNFSFTQITGPARTALITLLGNQIAVTQVSTLGTVALMEGPAAGIDSDVVSFPGSWTATANVSWLHTTSSGNASGLATFSFDANPGGTRSGTLTIAGATLTVTQAGSSYVVANSLTTLVPYQSGLLGLHSVAVDAAGNVYIADGSGYGIDEWNAATQQDSTLITASAAQLAGAQGVAVDAAGNVYIADADNGAIKKWNAETGAVTTLVSSGLLFPGGLAVDALGNVYIADTRNDAVEEWNAATGTVTTLVSSGLFYPGGVAVDAAGNVYIADTYDNAVDEWNAASGAVTTLNFQGLSSPQGVAVDGSGNVYTTNNNGSQIEELQAATGTVITLASAIAGLYFPRGLAVDASGNVYIADPINSGVVEEVPRAFVSATAISEPAAAGSDALPPVLPASELLAGPLAPTSDQSWLTIGSVSGGVVNFSFTQNTGVVRTAHITVLGQQIAVTQQAAAAQVLGTSVLLEGPAAGSDADIVNVPGSWTATANASWLHTTSSGGGGGLATFSFDANPGGTRSGTLTIAGQTLTVTQAGSGYVATPGLISLVGVASPYAMAVDTAGNVYYTDAGDFTVVNEWNATTQTVSTPISAGLNEPFGVAADRAGNLYIADTANNAIEQWNAATSTVNTLVSGLNYPEGVAVDALGNVYFSDTFNNAIKEWNAATGAVSTLVSGLNQPRGVAVDALGNVYFADEGNDAIKEWSAATGAVNTLVSTGLFNPYCVAVDGSGNVYIADSNNNLIKEWNPTTDAVTTLVSSGLYYPQGVAVDGADNLYIADCGDNEIKELPRAFVPGGAMNEGAAAGSDALAAVLPGSQSLTGVFAPTSDQSWLTIGSVAGGVVNFSFTQNTGVVRTAHITVLGQPIAIIQTASQPPTLGTSALLEGPAADSDADVVTYSGAWTATANASWLHTTSSGSGEGIATFSFDANPGATRIGTLTIAGQTLTVTQAGSGYVAAQGLTTLVSSGLVLPRGVAVDGAGNVYIADTDNNAIKEWSPATQTVTDLGIAGLRGPNGVAVDGAGNVYITDGQHHMLKEWNPATQSVSTLVSTGLSFPYGVAVDSSGNVYIADINGNAIDEWNAATGTVSTLLSGLNGPSGVAVDAAGNVYFTQFYGNGTIDEWNAATGMVSTLIGSGLYQPYGVAVDGSGNVYVAEYQNSAIVEWHAATGAVSTVVSTIVSYPQGVAVDGSGNVYIAETDNDAIEEVPRAFVPGSPVSEAAAAGSDALDAILPATQSLTGVFAPASDQGWLSIGAVSGGVVNFSFTANSGAARSAHITLLGEQITVTQAAAATPGTLFWDGTASGNWTDNHWTGAIAAYPTSGFGAVVSTASVVQVTSAQAADSLLISGGGQVAVASAATLTVTSDTSVSGGTLQVDPNGSFTTGGTFTLDSGGSVTGGPVVAAAYQLDAGIVSADLAGTGGLTKDTADTVVLSGADVYSGPTMVKAGTLILNSDGALPVGGNLTIGAGGDSAFGPSQSATSGIAASGASAATVTASAPVNLPAPVPRVAPVAATPPSGSSAVRDAVFTSYPSALFQTALPANDSRSASPWAWFIDDSWGPSESNQTTNPTVAALDKVLARFGV